MKPPTKLRCIYVDNSNIYIGGKKISERKGEDKTQFRIDFMNFLCLITQGTFKFQEMVWDGSGSKEILKVLRKVKRTGADVLIIPRPESGENETVDSALQLSMYRHVWKYKNRPGTIVLCTGDGKGYDKEKGFLYDVVNFVREGWDFELYCWNKSCHKKLKEFAIKNGAYVPLEKYYDSITFIENGRNSKPLHF
jgi:hypothetical protein